MLGKTKMYASGPVVRGFMQCIYQCILFIQVFVKYSMAEEECLVRSRHVPRGRLFKVVMECILQCSFSSPFLNEKILMKCLI